jgi:hypothetical protein
LTSSETVSSRKGSIFGRGVAKAWADTEITRPRITVVNGGATRVFFYTVLTNPARVRALVVGKIKQLRTGPWKYRLDYRVPKTLQVVAGVPITVTATPAAAAASATAARAPSSSASTNRAAGPPIRR